jgi:hypothetical protein
LQDELLEGDVVGRAKVSGAATMTVVLDGIAESIERLAITSQERGADGDLGHLPVLGIDEAQIAGDRRIYLFGGEDVDDVDVVATTDEIAKAGFESRLVEEIGQDDNDSLAGVAGGECLACLFEVAATVGGESFDFPEHS